MADELDQSATFTHKLADGTLITVGHPQGILRMRVRQILGDLFKDDELRMICQAFLSIRQLDSLGIQLNNRLQFEGLMTRFGSEDNLDEFMDKYQRLLNPELSKVVAEVMAQALEQNWSSERMTEEMHNATLPFAKARIDKLRD